MKKYRITESRLRNLIRESIRQAIYEGEAWANHPPIDKFHPDWWYYRQEIGSEGMEDDLYDAGNGTAEEDKLNGDNWNQSQYPPLYGMDRDWD